MKIDDDAELEARLQSMTIQQLLHLQGIASPNGLTHSDESVPSLLSENFDTKSHWSLEDPKSRIELLRIIEDEIHRRMSE